MTTHFNKWAFAKLIFIFLLLQTTPGYADVLPGSAQPEQINRSMFSVVPDELPPSAPPVQIELPQGEGLTTVTPAAEKLKFKFNGVHITGNKIIPADNFSPIYANDLHHTITLARLLEIVQAITDVYHRQGYITSRAILPVQKTKNGIVQIDIVEGNIDKVYVVGEPHKSAALVKKYGEKIARHEPLQIYALERYTLLANEIPATGVHSILKASPSVNGASDLYMLTDHQNVTGYISYDNYRTRYIGPQQITVDLAANSLFLSGDSTNLVFAKTPRGHELTFINANYDLPMNAEGDRFLVGVIHDKTQPLFVLRPFKINGTDNNYYTSFSFPALRTTSANLTYFLNANYENTDVTTFQQNLYTDQIRSLGAGTAFNNIDRLSGINSFYGDIRQGLPILGYSTNTNPYTARTSRPGGHALYTKLDVSISRLQPLFWRFSLYGLLKGQYGFQALLAAEQFPYGGIDLGRGYDIAEILGDRALAGTVEARFDMSINKIYLNDLEFYTFYDFGKVWNIGFYSNLPPNQSATSAGVGARFYFNRYISGNVTWAQPLTKQVAAEELIGRGRLPRTFFSIIASL